MTTFSSDIRSFRRISAERLDDIRKTAIIQMYSMITLATPVDTGRLRGNWQTTVGRPATGETERLSPSGNETIQSIGPNTGGVRDAVFFTNNLPYAARIEFEGWSAQAPEGMVRSSAILWPEIVKAAAKRFR